MSGRIRRSLAVRLPRLYQAILARWRPAALPAKPLLPVTVLTFSGSAQVPLLREALRSLYQAWPRLPEVRVVSDGTLDRAQLDAALGWWPGELGFDHWRSALAELGAVPDLARFAEREVSGRKLASIFAAARRGPTLFVDTDVLWFRFPERLTDLLGAPPGRATLLLSSDVVPSYDRALVAEQVPHLAEPPFYCCGFGFAAGDLLAACELDGLLRYAAEHGTWFTEQTIFAEAARQLGGEAWPAEEVDCPTADWASLRPTFRRRSWVARHYVSPVRHLFWLDSLALHLQPGSRS